MGLYEQTAGRFATAQRILAKIQGSDTTANGYNVVIAGTPYLGVWGNATVEDVISVGGGFRRVAGIPLTITRAQLATAPEEKTTYVTRTDISPQQIYQLDAVDDHDPHHFTLYLWKNGS